MSGGPAVVGAGTRFMAQDKVVDGHLGHGLARQGAGATGRPVRRHAGAENRRLIAWMGKARGGLTPPAGVDAPAGNAFIVAAVQHLVLASAAAGQFSGLPLAGELDWLRVRDVVRSAVRALLTP